MWAVMGRQDLENVHHILPANFRWDLENVHHNLPTNFNHSYMQYIGTENASELGTLVQ